MRRRILAYMAMAMAAMMLFGCGASTKPISYTNKELGVQFEYPNQWSLREDVLGANVAVIAPTEKLETFAANFVVVVSDKNDALFTLSAEEAYKAVENSVEGFSPVVYETIKWKEMDAVHFKYSYTQETYTVLVDQYQLIHGDKTWSFAFTCDKAASVDSEKDFMEIRDSIAFTS